MEESNDIIRVEVNEDGDLMARQGSIALMVDLFDEKDTEAQIQELEQAIAKLRGED